MRWPRPTSALALRDVTAACACLSGTLNVRLLARRREAVLVTERNREFRLTSEECEQ
jgi:hypothetical protein